jgi:hypothetical protein
MISLLRDKSVFEILVVFSLVCVALPFPTEGAIAASHSHSRNRSPSKEREDDGAFSPRDKSHFDSAEGGGHRSEFDHEAILGKDI